MTTLDLVTKVYADAYEECDSMPLDRDGSDWEIGRKSSNCIEAKILLNEQCDRVNWPERWLKERLDVYEAFAGFRTSLPDNGLKHWSHCLAALSWDDREKWVTKAAANEWSVRQMRAQRKKTLPDDDPPATPSPPNESPAGSDDVASSDPPSSGETETVSSDSSEEHENNGENDTEEKNNGNVNNSPDVGRTFDISPKKGLKSENKPQNLQVPEKEPPFEGDLLTYVDSLFKQHISPLTRALGKIRDKNGGEGECYEIAYDHLNDLADMMLKMREGER